MRAEETPNDVFATGGSYKKPKNGSQRTLPVSYDVFGRESEPVRQSSPLDFASKISTCYKQQKVINVHVSSLDHYTVENSNRNTGLSAATSFIIDLVNDVIPQQSQRFSDCLSSATEAGKQLACDKTEDCLLVDQIYLGIFRLACNSNETGGSAEAQKLSVHVACVGNQCTLRGFYNHDDADIIEDISFEQIEKIMQVAQFCFIFECFIAIFISFRRFILAVVRSKTILRRPSWHFASMRICCSIV